MIIEVPKVPPEGTEYVGEEPPELLDLEKDPFARADGPIRYELFAEKVGSELVVTGRLEAPVKLSCGRCGDFFSTTLEVSSFLHAYEISEGTETVDLSADIREDVLLELPAYPKCSWQGEGVCPFSGVNVAGLKLVEVLPEDNRWSVLDGLSPKPAKKKKKTGKV